MFRVLVRPALALALLASLAPAAHAAWLPNGNSIGLIPPEQTAPHVASDGRGGVFAAWTAGRQSRLRRFAADGAYATGWPAEGVLLPPDDWPLHYRVQQVAVMPAADRGVYVACFLGHECDHSCLGESGTLALQRRDATGAAAAGWPADGIQLEQAEVDGYVGDRVHMVPDERGGAVVAWTTSLYLPVRLRQVAVQAVSASGARRWGPDGVEIARSSGIAASAPVVADDDGGAFVFWAEMDSARAQVEVRAQHVSRQGRALWRTGGRPVSRGHYADIGWLGAVSDGDGGAIVTWTGTSTPATPRNLEILGARITQDGRPAWPRDLPLAAKDDTRFEAQLVGTRDGAIAAWAEVRDPGFQVRAQSIDRHGRIQWPAAGLCVSDSTQGVLRLAMTRDGERGAYLAWGDVDSVAEVRAMRLLADGRPARGWAARGSLVYRHPASDRNFGPIEFVDLAPLPGGGAAVAWSDELTPPSGLAIGVDQALVTLLTPHGPVVSAQGIPALAAAPAPVPAPVTAARTAFALHPVAPNPTAGPASIRFALPDASPAALELFDVAGRRVWSSDVGALGAGEHVVSLADAARAPGLYLVRLRQGERSAITRMIVLRK